MIVIIIRWSLSSSLDSKTRSLDGWTKQIQSCHRPFNCQWICNCCLQVLKIWWQRWGWGWWWGGGGGEGARRRWSRRSCSTRSSFFSFHKSLCYRFGHSMVSGLFEPIGHKKWPLKFHYHDFQEFVLGSDGRAYQNELRVGFILLLFFVLGDIRRVCTRSWSPPGHGSPTMPTSWPEGDGGPHTLPLLQQGQKNHDGDLDDDEEDTKCSSSFFYRLTAKTLLGTTL